MCSFTNSVSLATLCFYTCTNRFFQLKNVQTKATKICLSNIEFILVKPFGSLRNKHLTSVIEEQSYCFLVTFLCFFFMSAANQVLRRYSAVFPG